MPPADKEYKPSIRESNKEMREFYAYRNQELSGALERWQEERKVRNDPNHPYQLVAQRGCAVIHIR